MASSVLVKVSRDEEERARIMRAEKTELDYISYMAHAEEEGFKKRDNELIDNAKKALADGIPIEHIQKITGFDLETINGLK